MVLILLDIPVNVLCLTLMLRIMGRQRHIWRVLLAAFAGALAAQAIRFLHIARTSEMLMWMPLACIMVRIAGNKRVFRAAGILLSCYGLVGGTVMALAGALGSLRLAWALGMIAVGVMTVCSERERCMANDVLKAYVRITYAGHTSEFEAMVDSGNCLRDYLTHRPVLVLPEMLGYRFFMLEKARLRPIFADTAGGRQMMSCFTPQRMQITTGEQTRDVRCVVALSPAMKEDMPALLPQSLLDTGFEDEEGDVYGKTTQ